MHLNYYVSMDAENWIEAGRIENCPQEENVWRIIDCDESVQGKYVKLDFRNINFEYSAISIYSQLYSIFYSYLFYFFF